MIVAEVEQIIIETPIDVPNFNSYKKANQGTKKQKGKEKKDYRKNICGYITKKIVRQFMAPIYE